MSCHSRYILIFLLTWVVMATGGLLWSAEEDILYRELAPRAYRVDMAIHWDQRPEWTREYREAVEEELFRSLSRSVGSSWEMNLAKEPILPSADEEALRNTDGPLDYEVAGKLFLVVIQHQGSDICLAVREGDRVTGEWGLVWTRRISDDRLLVSNLHQLIGRAFRPLYQISGIRYDQIDLIATAGEWVLDDSDFQCFQRRSLARPVLVYRDREGKIVKRQSLPLTYLSLESRDRGRIQSRLISAFPGPLGSGRKKRVELWALGGKMRQSPAEVRLVLQGASHRVLMGHRVVVQPKRHLKDETSSDPVELLSDRFGQVSISSVGAESLIWIYVWSGEALLARVPFVPGWSEEETLPLPDDSDRLRVEGELDRLRADLIADVSRRAISRIQILRLAKSKDEDGVSRLLEKHGELKDRKDYQSRLELIETGGVQAAEASGNRVAAARIKKSCSEMSLVINRFLDSEREAEFRQEVAALLKLP